MPEIRFIPGNCFSDDRGSVNFVNDFDFPDIKRFYIINHPDTKVVRAWQGHKIEQKYFHVVKGSFVIAWVEIDNWELPSTNLAANYKILNAREPGVLCVPAGFANGIKALQPDSTLITFSNLGIEECSKDDWRFEKSLWLDWNKF